MRDKLSVFILITLLISLTACSSNKEASSTETISEIYTSVAITLTAQYTPDLPTNTPEPTFTYTVEPGLTETPLVATTQPAIEYSSVSSSTSNSCDSSTYISDVTIADGTVMAPGEAFDKTWLIENNGSCEWTEDYEIVYVSGNDMDGVDTEIDTEVSSGEQVKVTVSMIAPESTGTYTGFWKMMNEEGETFGTSVYVQIVVSDSASTITATSTATTYTSTPTSTSASASTSTPTITATTVIVPSNTPVPTAVPTNTPTSTTVPTEAVVETEEIIVTEEPTS